MEISNPKIKKFLIFSQKSPPHFSAQARKNKKIHPKKNALNFRKWNLFALIFKKFRKWKPLKKSLVFQEMEVSNSKIKKFLIFSQNKRKVFLYSLKKAPHTFWPRPPKVFLKSLLWKSFLYFLKENRNFQKRKPRKNPYISGNGTFLYFRRRHIFILQETELSYTSGKGTFLYFRKQNFIIFWERHIQSHI